MLIRIRGCGLGVCVFFLVGGGGGRTLYDFVPLLRLKSYDE